ncbi:FG-GAP and VCBS repeat-containing protein [Actinomadura fulvescens]|uniref:VCBS repeat-containing protein n=1 Tax=Actinomadura fulvescens TaxID=46160 RepID=A0ABP6BMB8_9ACTN
MKKRSLTAFSAAAAISVALGGLGAVAAPAAAAPLVKPAKRSDFNGDGHIDLVAGSSWGTGDGKEKAGFLTVVYGGPAGPRPSARQVLTQDSPGIPGSVRKEGYWGWTTASADFDRDGYADLAVSSQDPDPASPTQGAVIASVVIIYGGPRGLSDRTVTLATNDYGVVDLAVGDFDRNKSPDLVAAVRYNNARLHDGQLVFANVGARAVPGVRTTLKIPRHPATSQTLASADFNGDGYHDLGLVTAGHYKDGPYNGELQVRLGSRKGLGAVKILGRGWDAHDLATGDVNGDGKADLVALKYSKNKKKAGLAVHYGTKTGLGRVQTLNRDTRGVPGKNHWTGDFGYSLAVGDFNGDRKADVATGDNGATLGGSVTILNGAKSGLTTRGAKWITQNTAGVPGASEQHDGFGNGLSAFDANRDGKADLTVGAPGENTPEGWLYLFRGSRTGITVKGLTHFGPPNLGIGGRNAQLGGRLLP